jgi:alpha-tubulin suppressor-like RCC1 family protein
MSLFPVQDVFGRAISRLRSPALRSFPKRGGWTLVSPLITAFLAACWVAACACLTSLTTTADVFPYGLGANGLGQVGDGALSDRNSPVALVSGDRPVAVQLTKISAGGAHSLALGSDGKVYAWGGNASGQLGDGTTSDRSRAVVVGGGDIPVGVSLQQVSAGGSHSLGLGSDGKVYAWGANGYGQLGDGTLTERTRPVAVSAGEIPSGVTITEVRAGREHSLALGSDGKVYAWGRNGSGQLGDGTVESRSLPVAVVVGSVRYSGIAAGRFHSLGLATDGKVYGWGGNGFGQLGDGGTESRLEPVHSSGLNVLARSVGAGWVHSVVLGVDGKAYSWGGNAAGQLGDGTVEERTVAVAAVGVSGNLKSVVAGGEYSLGLGNDGVVYGWGANESGQLGDGTKVNRRSAVAGLRGEIRNGLVVGSVSAGSQHALILADGEPALEPPEISAGSLSGTYGSAVSGKIEASGRSILGYTAVGLPEGLTLDTTTGVITGVAGQVGVFSVTVSARNAAGTGTGTLTVEFGKKELTVTGLSASSKEYDGTTSASVSGTPVLVGVVGTDAVSLSGSGVGSFADKRVGSVKTVTVGGYGLSGDQADRYLLSSVSLSASITAKTVTVSGFDLVRKDYDGTRVAVLKGTSRLSGVIVGDDAVLGGSPEPMFDTAAVGAGKAVSVIGLAMEGIDAANYVLGPVTLAGEIEPKGLRVSGLSVVGRLYDGTRVVSVTGTATVSGLLAGESATVIGSPVGQLATPGVGSGIGVVVSGLSLSGAQAGNYRVVAPTLSATITPKAVSVSGLSVVTRPFNGGLSAEITGTPVLVGVVSSDAVGVTGAPVGRFSTADIGLNKLVSVNGLSLSGAQAGNYSLEALTLRGRIEAANLTLTELTIQGLTVVSRVYDGTREATLSGAPTLVGITGGDVVTLGGAPEASFLTADAGTGKRVVVGGYTLGGADAAKYRLTQPSLTGTIETKSVMVGGIAAQSKGYDGTRVATLNGTPVLVGVLSGDTVTLSGSGVGQFASAAAGQGQPVSVSGFSLGGAQAGNYRLEAPALKASIWTDVSGVRIEVGYGFGANAQGQVGHGQSGDATGPVLVANGARASTDRWLMVSAGGAHSLALGSDGKVYAWGGNASGQLGDGTTSDRSRAVVVGGGDIPVGVSLQQVSAGGSHSLGLGSDGKVYAWGANGYGQLGDGTLTERTRPVAVSAGEIPSGVTITEVRAGREHSLALGSDGKVYAWGRNGSGQLGDGTVESRSLPVAVVVGSVRYSGIAAGRFHSLGLATDGKVYGWGGNGFGQLGDGTTDGRLEPVLASGLSGLAQGVSAGWVHSVVLGVDGKAYAWGGNNTGQLGDGTVAEHSTAVAVLGISVNLKSVVAGGEYSLGLGNDGVVYGWGANESGQLGDGTKVNRRSAVAGLRGEIRNGLVVGSVSAGSQHALILADGEPALEPPEISAGSLSGTYGSAVSGKIEASGQSILGYTAVGLPEGLTLDTTTGVITGVAGQVGVFSVTVSARNAAGTGTGTLTVEFGKKELTVTGLSASSKEYDGTTSASVSGTPVLVGVVGTDAVSLSGSGVGSFADKRVGSVKTVTVGGYGLSGDQADRYLLSSVSLSASITAKTVTVSGFDLVRKDYDGTRVAVLKGTSRLSGVIVGDDAVLGGSPEPMFDTAAVGAGKAVSVIGLAMEGIDAANYVLGPVTLAGEIEPKGLRVSGLSVVGRLYDGTRVVSVTGTATVSGLLAGESATVIGSPVGQLATPGVGSGIGVVVSGLSLSGAQAGNYRVVAPTLSATITPKAVSVSGLSVVTRPFNGGLSAEITGTPVLVGVVSSDAVGVTGAPVGRFSTADIGLNKLVSVNGLSLSGAQAGNYSLEALTLRGRIEAANLTLTELTIQGLTVVSRVYDGTREATLSGAPTLVGITGGDVVTLGGAPEASFLTADAGTGKRVVVGGYTLGGADAAKYRLTQPSLTGTIETKSVMVGGIAAQSKGYDGTRVATLNGTPVLVGVLSGDTVTLSGSGVGQFASAAAGQGQPVSVSGFSLGGAQAGNYRLEAPALKASIWTDVSGVRIEVGYGFGANAQGQVGHGQSGDATGPVLVANGARASTDRWLMVSAGGAHSLALGSDGKVYAWGGNASGQLGDGTTSDRSRAVVVGGGDIPVGVSLQQVSAGGSHSLGLGSDGKVYAWGANGYGQLGDGTLTERTRPVAVSAGEIPSGVTITEVRAGREHSLALGSDGKVYAWGRNGSGQLGDGTLDSRSLPVAVVVGSVRYSGIAAGRFHSLGLATDGKVYGWGGNGFGQLGDGTTDGRLEPVLASGLSGLAQGVSAGWVHSVVLGVDGKAYAWGGNNAGQLGDGTVAEHSTAVAVLGISVNLKSVVAGGEYSLGLGNDGVVYGWGANESGQLGDGTKVNRRSAVAGLRGEIRNGLVVGSVSAGSQHALILADGEPALEPPEISAGSLSGTYGSAVSGKIEASGRSIVEYGAVGLPEGLVLDTTTGVITGIPSQVGSFPVTVSARNAAGNGTGTLTVELRKKELTVTGLSASSKEYDGTTLASVSGTPVLVGVVGTDAVSLSGRTVGQFADASAGTSKLVSVSGYSLSGAKAGNYSVASALTLSADIEPRLVSLSSVAAVSKNYDGTALAEISGLNSWVNVVAGDFLVADVVSARFARSSVGTGLAVSATLQLYGASSSNYRLVQPTGLRADIRPAPVVILLAGTIRTYTGAGQPVLAVTVPDNVPVSMTYDGKTNLPVVAGTYSVTARASSENYLGVLSGTLEIQPKTVTGIVTVQDKAFDGSTLATISSRRLEGVVANDSLQLQLTEARFDDPLMGVSKSVIPIGATLVGASAPNYRLGGVSVVPAAILNNPPVFDAFPRLVAVEAKTMQELITARDTDLPQQTLIYRLLEAPNGVTLTVGGLLQWIPKRTDVVGDYPILVEVSDGVASVQKRGVISVASTGLDPIVIPIADVSITENFQTVRPLTTPDPDLKGTLTWSLIQGPSGFAVSGSGQWTWQPGERLGGTRWTIVAEATDGRLSSRVAFKVQVDEDNQSPTWLQNPPPVGLEGQEMVWQLVASDADDPIQALSYRLVEGPGGLTVGNNGLVRWIPTEDQGPSTNRLQVAVSDGVVSVTNLFEIQVIEANQPPAWSGQATLTLDEGALLERSGLATDADRPAQTLAYTLVSGPVGLSLSRAGLMQWRPSEAQGPSTNLVRITVTDGLEVVARDYTLVVRELNQAPVWSAEPARETREGSPYQFRLGATDLDLPAQTLAYRLLSGPFGLSVRADGLVQWSPTEAQGPSTNEVEVAVSDGILSVTNRVRIQVQEINADPVWFGGTTVQSAEDQTLALQLPVLDSDLPKQALRFTLESGPIGLQISTNGLLTWTPTEAQGPTTNQVRFRVSDGLASVPLEFDIVVSEANQAPVWTTAVGTRRVNEGALLSFTVSATDTDLPAQPLSYRLVNAPWGMTLSTNGLVSWRPTEVQGPSTNRVRITVGDGYVTVPLEFDVVVRDAITGTPGPSLSLSPRSDGSWSLRVSGIGGARYQVEQLTVLGVSWTPVSGVSEVVTQGSNAPVTLILPAQAVPSRFFRLGKR